MYLLKSTRICYYGLYNNRFKTKVGFFNPSQTFNEVKTDYEKLTFQNRTDSEGNRIQSNISNYGIYVQNTSSKLDLLQRSISHIFNKWPNYKVCIYANGYRANHILKSSKIIQKYPASKAYQTHFKRQFRRGNKILLLSDNVFAKIPKIDFIIHYNLPGTLDVFAKRLAANKSNLYFYGKHEKIFMAQLQNYLNVVVEDWILPSNQSSVETFLNQIEIMLDSKIQKSNDCNDSERLGCNELDNRTAESSDKVDSQISKVPKVNTEISKLWEGFDKKRYWINKSFFSLLSSFLYMIHNKFKGMAKREYLIYDPKFKVFKSRESVMKYLNENGVVYTSVNLCKNGFIIESMNEVSLSCATPVIKYKKFTSHIRKVKKLIRRSYLSTMNRRKYFKKLVREHERKIINKLKAA